MACAKARARDQADAAWTEAHGQADEALRALVAHANPSYAAQARFGTAPGAVPGEAEQAPTGVLSAFLPFRLPARWHWVAVGPDSTLEYWLAAVDKGYRGRFPWAPLVRWYVDTRPPRIHERRATVSVPEGRAETTRRPRLASQATTGRWVTTVRAGEIDGVLVAAKTQVPRTDLHVYRPEPPPSAGRLFHLPLPPRDERLTMVAAFDRHNPVLRGDASLLLDIAHMSDVPVRGSVPGVGGAFGPHAQRGVPVAQDTRLPPRVGSHPGGPVYASAGAGCRGQTDRSLGPTGPRRRGLEHNNASRPGPGRDRHRSRPVAATRVAEHRRMDADGGRWRARQNRITVGEQSMAGLIVSALEYYLAGYYDGRPGVSRHLAPDHPGGPGPIVVLPWPSVMYLVGDPWEFASEKQRSAAYARFRRAMDRLQERGYFVPGAVLGGSAPAGDSVEILACSGRPARVWLRASDWFCAAAKQVAERPDGFAQVPLGDYLRRNEWRVPVHRAAAASR